eukprot:scaffold23822_cov22-Prasinocladus_malaysianus.AAC.1
MSEWMYFDIIAKMTMSFYDKASRAPGYKPNDGFAAYHVKKPSFHGLFVDLQHAPVGPSSAPLHQLAWQP